MRKPKIACFRYKRHNDIYVSKAFFSIDLLLSTIDSFLDKKILALIESEEVQTLLSISKNIGTMKVIPCSQGRSFLVLCIKTDLFYLLNQVKIEDFEELFIANIKRYLLEAEFITFSNCTGTTTWFASM